MTRERHRRRLLDLPQIIQFGIRANICYDNVFVDCEREALKFSFIIELITVTNKELLLNACNLVQT